MNSKNYSIPAPAVEPSKNSPKSTRPRVATKALKPSITSSPFTNNPLWSRAKLIDINAGYVDDGTRNTFCVSAEGYIAMVCHMYDIIPSCEKEFSRFVSQSKYEY